MADDNIIPDIYPCPPGEYKIPHTENVKCSKFTVITSLGRRYVGPFCDKYWLGGTPVPLGLRAKFSAFGQTVTRPVLCGIDEGLDGPSFWAQAQTDDAVKIVDSMPSRVLSKLKEQLRVPSGTQLSAPALYGLGGGQHSVGAYLQKYCTPIPALSATDVLQALRALHQQSLHTQWGEPFAARAADKYVDLILDRDGCFLRVRLEKSVLFVDVLVLGSIKRVDLSLMGLPERIFSQAQLGDVLQRLEESHRCAGASAACAGKYDSILGEKRTYLDQQGEICGHQMDEFILTRDGLFNRTVRSTACSQLVPEGGLLCKACKHLQRSQLDSTLKRARDREQAGLPRLPETETYEQAAARAKEARRELKNTRRREARLKRKLAQLQSGGVTAILDEMLRRFEDAQKGTVSTSGSSMVDEAQSLGSG